MTIKQQQDQTEAAGGASELTVGLGEWVPIKERQPENGMHVLFCCADCDANSGDVGIGYYLDEDKQLWLEEGGFWMPCPKAPNAEVKGGR